VMKYLENYRTLKSYVGLLSTFKSQIASKSASLT
jgi:hypothetical protein